MRSTHFIAIAAAGLFALLAGATVRQFFSQEKAAVVVLESGTALGAQARSLPAFSLVDHQGKTFTDARLRGRWSLIFFGYTHCPDICPNTLAVMKQAMKQLHEHSVQPQVIFISVDPKRDTPERLAKYVRYFDPDFIGATGSEEALAALAPALGIPFARPPGSDSENYLVDHGASVLLIDPSVRSLARSVEK